MRRVEENSSILVCISRLAKITTCFREIGEISPSSILSPPLVNLYPFIYLSQMVEKQHHLCQNFQSTGCFFERFHPEKFLVYGIGPSQQDKIAKYTGPTQSYQMSELLTNNFCCQKNYCFVELQSIQSYTHFITMVRVWTVRQRTFLVERKLQGADLAQITAEYAQR